MSIKKIISVFDNTSYYPFGITMKYYEYIYDFSLKPFRNVITKYYIFYLVQ